MFIMFDTLYTLYGLCIIFSSFLCCAGDGMESESDTKSLVEVRAVFINCQLNEGLVSPDTEAARFQREELFKHNSLKDCNTKLALVLKVASIPERSSDEYIPIDHVVEGPTKKRIRLLNPYVLRLRWENPLQAYKLQNMDTVTGVLTETDERFTEKRNTNLKKDRVPRSSEQIVNEKSHSPTSYITGSTDYEKDYGFVNYFNTSLLRKKRQQHNIMVEPQMSDEISWVSNFDSTNGYDRSLRTADFAEQAGVHRYDKTDELQQNEFWKKNNYNFDNHYPQNAKYSHGYRSHPEKSRLTVSSDNIDIRNDEPFKNIESPDSNREHFQDFTASSERSKPVMKDVDSDEETFSIYDIGNPDIWCIVHVQLFEKLSTPEGQTVWNDITKGETASISSIAPEWRDQDLNVRYRSVEWTAQSDFTLPVASNLCLLVPRTSDGSEYYVVPTEDVVLINDNQASLKKRNENSSEYAASNSAMKKHRKVMVRVTRALQSGGDDLKIVKHGSEQFLTLPHRRPHHIQIELEARADDNQLIRVGSYGRITTAVSDNSRRTRTVFTVQATNTGLAAAKFKIKARDCGPELSSLIKDRSRTGAETELIMVPPRHTRRISLDLPIEIPGDTAHCSLALINQDDESVAIRDVTVKRGDRCFCVWHCDCVCLSEDPKLLCQEMSEPRQAAAGLSRDRARRTRSLCYPDHQYINLSVVVGGVLTLLLFLGFMKASLGLISRDIGMYNLDKIVEFPRKLERYHEACLANRRVVYDKEGWPVHPDTKERSVRLLSRGVEFTLNLIFFITMPCMICWNGVKLNLCATKCPTKGSCIKKNSKSHFNAVDFQEKLPRLRRRRGRLRGWMTPEAEHLSTNLWHDGLFPQRSTNCKFMQPLLHEDESRANESQSSSVDSEQDDTEYVLTQMQKSRESLARTQMMNNHSPPTK